MSTYILHSAKGSTWKKHKYIKIENGRYVYPKKETEGKSGLERKQTYSKREESIKSKEKPRATITTNPDGSGTYYNRKTGKLEIYNKGGISARKEIDELNAQYEARRKAKAVKKQKEQMSKILNKAASYMTAQKKINKTSPTKSTSAKGTKNTNRRGVDIVTNVSISSTKKPKLNNYKISTGSNQKSSGTGRSPVGNLSNISKSKRKTQVQYGSKSSIATSSNASKSTSSNAERKKKKKR